MIINGRRDLEDIGCYVGMKGRCRMYLRDDPQRVHFETRSMVKVPTEMKQFISWFNTVHEAQTASAFTSIRDLQDIIDKQIRFKKGA